MSAQNVLRNFNVLVKNRLGPYKIVLRHNNGRYWSTQSGWTKDISDIKDYDYYTDSQFWKQFLITAAGNIELSRKDFK